jgi:anti-anti-sigma factor
MAAGGAPRAALACGQSLTMQVAATTRGDVTIVTPTGVIDTRTAQAFEATLVQAFGGGARSFAVDFGSVTLITSAGIRVLVMMTHRLARVSGGLVLFALPDRVRTVFEIGGLLQQFRITSTEAQAIESLAKPVESASATVARPSRLASLLFDIVCVDAALHQGLTTRAMPPAGSVSPVTRAVTEALVRWSPPGAGPSSSS